VPADSPSQISTLLTGPMLGALRRRTCNVCGALATALLNRAGKGAADFGHTRKRRELNLHGRATNAQQGLQTITPGGRRVHAVHAMRSRRFQ